MGLIKPDEDTKSNENVVFGNIVKIAPNAPNKDCNLVFEGLTDSPYLLMGLSDANEGVVFISEGQVYKKAFTDYIGDYVGEVILSETETVFTILIRDTGTSVVDAPLNITRYAAIIEDPRPTYTVHIKGGLNNGEKQYKLGEKVSMSIDTGGPFDSILCFTDIDRKNPFTDFSYEESGIPGDVVIEFTMPETDLWFEISLVGLI